MILYARYHAASWVCLWVLVLVVCLPVFSFAPDAATVVKVVDGDTLDVTLNSCTERVRLIGVDTPEKFESDKLRRDVQRTGQDEKTIKALGERASEFTKSVVRPGSQVQLEYDQQSRDRYKRLLAFVWLPDGHMLNETIICEGYANALTRYPFRQDYMDRFRACEHQAREQGKGLWSEGLVPDVRSPAPQPISTADGEIRGNRKSKIYHLPGCPDYQRLSAASVVPFKTETDARQAGYRKAKNCP